MSVLDKIQKKINDCTVCNGKIYYTGKTKLAKRCPHCYKRELFQFRFREAQIDEKFIDRVYAEKVRELFKGQLTIVMCDWNVERQRKWANSAALVATSVGLRTAIYSDKDLIDTVFNRAGTEERKAWDSRFLDPQFLVIFLGTVVNRNFIGSYVMELFWQRERHNKLTFGIIPSLNKVDELYKDEQLKKFLETELLERKPKALYVMNTGNIKNVSS